MSRYIDAEKWRNTLKKIKYFKKDKAEEDNADMRGDKS